MYTRARAKQKSVEKRWYARHIKWKYGGSSPWHRVYLKVNVVSAINYSFSMHPILPHVLFCPWRGVGAQARLCTVNAQMLAHQLLS